jgi:hypothetical protein
MDSEIVLVLHRGLFVATVAVQLAALVGAARSRSGFQPDDLGHRTWSLFTAFLAIRLLAELRLATLYFGLGPTEEGAWRTFYVVVLRYLYTVSDALVILGLVAMIRGLRGLGLHFELRQRERIAMLLVAAMPPIAFALHERLTGFVGLSDDRSILVYRLVAVTITAFVAMLCIAILRYVRQMGGGAVARVWGAVVLAGLARAASFVTLAIVGVWSRPWADVAEQSLLMIFALAWWRASRQQRRLHLTAATGRG